MTKMTQPSFPHNKGKGARSVGRDGMFGKPEPRSEGGLLVMEVRLVSDGLFLSRGDLQGDKRLQAANGT